MKKKHAITLRLRPVAEMALFAGCARDLGERVSHRADRRDTRRHNRLERSGSRW